MAAGTGDCGRGFKMAARKLAGRRKRASKGRIIRISDLVYETLNAERHSRSWDSFLRKMLGLYDRAGREQPLIEGMLDTVTGRFFLRGVDVDWQELENKAYESAILAAATMKIKRISKPLRMREIP